MESEIFNAPGINLLTFAIAAGWIAVLVVIIRILVIAVKAMIATLTETKN